MKNRSYWAAYRAELARLDARRNCTTGYSCGSTCIPVKKECLKESGSSIGKERLRKIQALAGGAAPEGKGINRLRQGEAESVAADIQQRRSARAQELRDQRGQRSGGSSPEPEAEQPPSKGGALVSTGGKLSNSGQGESDQGDRSTGNSKKGWESQYFGRDLSDGELAEFIDRKVKLMDDPAALEKDPSWQADLFRRAVQGDATVRIEPYARLGLKSPDDLDDPEIMGRIGRDHAKKMLDSNAPDKKGEYRRFGIEAPSELRKKLEKLRKDPKATPKKIKALEDKLANSENISRSAQEFYERSKGLLDRNDPRELADLGKSVVTAGVKKAAEDDVNEFAAYLMDYGPKGAVYMNMREQLRTLEGGNSDAVSDLPNPFEFFNMTSAGRNRKATKANADRIADDALRTTLKRLGGSDAAADLLGVPTGNDLTPAQLKSAYRKAAAKAHPDAGGSNEQFRAVTEAYNSLKRRYNFDSLPSPYHMEELRHDAYARAYGRTWRSVSRRTA